MVRYRPISIKEEGLDNYLNRTALQHNNYSAVDFHKMLNLKVNDTNLAKVMGVHRNTIVKWKSLVQ